MIIHTMPQHSPDWYRIRLGKLTGTTFKSVVAPKGKPLLIIDKMLGEEVTGMSNDEDGYISDEMQRGIDLEPIAKQSYTELTGVEITNVGFVQSERWLRFGVSMDGLIGTTASVEAKCPETKTHIKYIREGIVPVEYSPQILSHFVANEKHEYVDFLSFDPRFTPQPLFIVRTTRDDVSKEIESAEIRLDNFFEMYEDVKQSVIFGTSVFIAQLDRSLNTMIIQ